jgi:hypothetical protein
VKPLILTISRITAGSVLAATASSRSSTSVPTRPVVAFTSPTNTGRRPPTEVASTPTRSTCPTPATSDGPTSCSPLLSDVAGAKAVWLPPFASGCGRSRPPILDPTAYRFALLTSVLIMSGEPDGASGVRRR